MSLFLFAMRPCLDVKFFLDFATVALLFVYGKYCPIINYLRSKYSSRDLQANCVISFSFSFRLYLMLLYAARFVMTGNLKNFLNF